jgi:hypothetical protein
VHNDDISQILILNKKSISNYEKELFQSELEKFRPHQNRLLQAKHKQSSLMKELTVAFNTLLQDKRVRSEQTKYESAQRQRAGVLNRYKRAYQEFLDLVSGLQGAKTWYTEMKETIESLEKNVQSFVHNRRTEGAQLLGQIESERSANKAAQAELERNRLRELMERMNVSQQASSMSKPDTRRRAPAPLFQSGGAPRHSDVTFASQYPLPSSPPPNSASLQGTFNMYGNQPGTPSFPPAPYNPTQYGINRGPTSPPPNHTSFTIGPRGTPASPPPTQSSFNQNLIFGNTYGNPQGQQLPARPPSSGYNQNPGYIPPPPPGPPPLGPQQTYHYGQGSKSAAPPQPPPQNNDPWAGLSSWK